MIINSAGYDAGYSYIKVAIRREEETKTYKFPSVINKAGKDFFNESSYEFEKSKMIVNYEGQNYYIGDYVYSHDVTGGLKDFKDNKFVSPEERAKLAASFSLATNQAKEITINNLCVGLNIEVYSDLKDQYINSLSDPIRFKLPGDKEERIININNIYCIPQGVGAYLYYEYIDKLDSDYWIGILDVGGKSVDSFIYNPKINQIVNGTVIGFNQGTSNAYKKVARKISHSMNYDLVRKAYHNENKLFWKGKEHNIKKHCENEFNELANGITSRVINEWDTNLNKVKQIILCGGGGEDITQHTEEYLDIKIITGDNAQYSNVLGFEIYARGKAGA